MRHSFFALTVELEVVVHDKAAGQAEGDVVVVLEGLQERVVQELRNSGAGRDNRTQQQRNRQTRVGTTKQNTARSGIGVTRALQYKQNLFSTRLPTEDGPQHKKNAYQVSNTYGVCDFFNLCCVGKIMRKKY